MAINKELFKQIVNQILSHPETWNQMSWHDVGACGSTHCVAGWAQVMSDKPQCSATCFVDARDALGITDFQADWLFSSSRSLYEIHRFASDAVSGKLDTTYDWRGYDAEGYDRAGFNDRGFDREGYDRQGYNNLGRDRDGRDENGYDTEGYDANGYNHTGVARNGVAAVLLPL